MDRSQLLNAAMAAAREAGDLLMDRLGHVSGIEKKGAVDLVTEADRASERLLVLRLSAALPGASILAEEGQGIRGDANRRWLVDPLDGTTNFAHGYPVFCVSLALEVDGVLVLGVVLDPTRNECFTALRGEGAFRDGKPIRVSATTELENALLVTGFPYDVHTSARDNLASFGYFVKHARAVRRDGSAALDLAYVACGRFDGFWEEKLAPWDMAAGALLVREAGGKVSDYLEGPVDLSAGNIVASNGPIHHALCRGLAVEDLRRVGGRDGETGGKE
jgi:myo-inositol-1(or 4)-monophosphatase